MTVVIAVRYDNITIIMLHCNIMVIIFKDSCIVISHVFLISYTNNDIGVLCKYRMDIDIGVWTIVDNERGTMPVTRLSMRFTIIHHLARARSDLGSRPTSQVKKEVARGPTWDVGRLPRSKKKLHAVLYHFNDCNGWATVNDCNGLQLRARTR